MDLGQVLLSQLLTNPLLQGALISFVVAQLKKFMASLDTSEKDPAAVKNVQMVVVGLSFLVTVLTAWAGGHLGELDTAQLTNFVTILISSLGVNSLGKNVKAVVKK